MSDPFSSAGVAVITQADYNSVLADNERLNKERDEIASCYVNALRQITALQSELTQMKAERDELLKDRNSLRHTCTEIADHIDALQIAVESLKAKLADTEKSKALILERLDDAIANQAEQDAKNALTIEVLQKSGKEVSAQLLSAEQANASRVKSEEIWALYQDVLSSGMGDPWDGEELEDGYVRPIPEGFESEVEKFDQMHSESIARLNACLDKIRDMGVRTRQSELLADLTNQGK